MSFPDQNVSFNHESKNISVRVDGDILMIKRGDEEWEHCEVTWGEVARLTDQPWAEGEGTDIPETMYEDIAKRSGQLPVPYEDFIAVYTVYDRFNINTYLSSKHLQHRMTIGDNYIAIDDAPGTNDMGVDIFYLDRELYFYSVFDGDATGFKVETNNPFEDFGFIKNHFA